MATGKPTHDPPWTKMLLCQISSPSKQTMVAPIRDGASQRGAHESQRVQVFENQAAVCLGQSARFPVHEVASNRSYACMGPRDAGPCTMTPARVELGAAERLALPAKLAEIVAKRTRALDARDLGAVFGSDDGERLEPAVDAHPRRRARIGMA